MDQRVKTIMEQLKKMKHFNRLEFVILFGSQAEGKARKDSDVDLCLYYNIPDRAILRKLLYNIRGRAPQRIDVSLFQLLPLQVRKEVFKGQILYQRRKYFIYDIAHQTFKEYERFAPLYKFYVLNTPSHPRRFMI